MEFLRGFQRQRLQSLLHARPVQTSLRQPRARTRMAYHSASLTSKTQATATNTRYRNLIHKFRVLTHAPKQPTRRFATASATATASENLSLSQRLKKLSREYGWSALGVYLALSALDFPFCFLAVRLLGTDRIGHWEHVVISKIKAVVKWPLDHETQDKIDGAAQEARAVVKEKIPLEEIAGAEGKRVLDEVDTYVITDHGYKEAKAANTGSDASIWTQLALAYAIHKSFIFIRVPLTAAVTPKVVKTLRSWGWNIGKRPGKSAAAGRNTSGTAGVNTKGSGVKSD